jgi:hypothetical protein
VSGNRHEKTTKKKAGLFRPGLLPFKTPVSALILRSAASKKQQKKTTRGNLRVVALRTPRNGSVRTAGADIAPFGVP